MAGFNQPSLLVYSVYRFHAYFHTQIILQQLGIPLPHEHGFNKVKNCCNKSAFYKIFDDYCNTADQIWMNHDWFCTPVLDVFSDGTKATKRFPSGNLTQSKGFLRKGIERASKSVRAYVYLVLTS